MTKKIEKIIEDGEALDQDLDRIDRKITEKRIREETRSLLEKNR